MKKNRRVLFISIILIPLSIFNNNLHAGDELSDIMRNDNDALIVGTVLSIEDGIMTIKSADQIISSSEAALKRERLWFDEVSFPFSVYAPERFSVGDHILVELFKRGEGSFAHGVLYKVSSTDIKTLKVENPFEPDRGAILTDFVNSGGLYTDHKTKHFEGGVMVIRCYLGEETVIYYHVEETTSSDSQNEETQSENLQKGNFNPIIYIIGGIACLLSLAVVIIDIFRINKPI